MRDFLVFRLCGPLASWGDIGIGEVRATWPRPSKSAVLGLVAGALGIARTEENQLIELDQNLGFAVRVDQRGEALRDYHTTQTAPSRRNVFHLTRRAELSVGRGELATILSERAYLTNARAVVALWAKGEKPPALAALAQALTRPRFTPYLGRKSCVLAQPMAPQILAGLSLPDVFALFDQRLAEREADLWPGLRIQSDRPDIWFELGAGIDASSGEHVSRRDGLRSRRGWTYRDRPEALLRSEEP